MLKDNRYKAHEEILRKTVQAFGGWEVIRIAWATRIRDGKEGLLFQHWNLPHDRKRAPHKKGSSFFIQTRDIAAFLQGLEKLLNRSVPMEIVSAFESELAKIERQIREQSSSEIDRLKAQMAEKDKFIMFLREKLDGVSRQRQRVRIIEMEKRLPEFEEALKNFAVLVNEGEEIAAEKGVQQESLYQEFLEENFWMFGLEYVGIIPKRPSEVADIPDLLLQRSDGFHDVVELENPTDQIFLRSKRHPEQSAELKEALAQIIDYLDDYAVRHLYDFYKDGLDTYKPKGIIVIGREGDRDLRRRRRQLNSYLHGIEIWTYDDLINKAKQIITLLKQGPSSSEDNAQSITETVPSDDNHQD